VQQPRLTQHGPGGATSGSSGSAAHSNRCGEGGGGGGGGVSQFESRGGGEVQCRLHTIKGVPQVAAGTIQHRSTDAGKVVVVVVGGLGCQ
jgi:hypothetical protein